MVLDRRAGSRCVAFRNGKVVHSAYWRLPDFASITECELHAIEQGVKWVIRNAQNGECWQTFTDSQAALNILNCRARTQKWEKARQITLLLKGNTDRVRLHWVPGHSEVEGNEIADQLATSGGNLAEVNAEGCVSGRTLARYLKEQQRIAIRFWWSTERTRLGTAIKEFFFCAYHASLWIHREVTPAASAIVFGRAMTPALRFRCGLAPSPECSCGAAVGDIRHYLRSCPFLEPARERIPGGVPNHLYKIITDLKRRKAFNRLCKSIMEHLDALHRHV